MHSPLKIKLTDLNPHLTCIICEGYFINATTITECLHSFCRSCIVKYLETNKYCPICEVQIHKTKPLLNLRSDQTLQDIVYKLVPGLFQNEMQRRKTFYASNPTVTKPADPELSGELSERSYIYTSDDYISLSLEYYNNNNNETSSDVQSRRYLRCPAAVSILHLQKLIRAKYGLTKDHKVDILYQNDALCEDFTLIDVAYIYLWKRKGPLHLTYRIFETECRKKIKYDFQNHEDVTSITADDCNKNISVSSATPNDTKLSTDAILPTIITMASPPTIKVSMTTTPVSNLITSVSKTMAEPVTHSIKSDSITTTATSLSTATVMVPLVSIASTPSEVSKMDNKQTNSNFLDNNLINEVTTSISNTTTSTSSSSITSSALVTDSSYLNNNNISDKQLNDVVLCDNIQHESGDKEVHLQISETGIISVTTSIASSAEITQTVTNQITKLPIENSTVSVIPMQQQRLKKSDLKSVRKNHKIPTTIATPIVSPSPTSTPVTVETQQNERKRKLSTDSTDGNTQKKSTAVVTTVASQHQVPLTSSDDMFKTNKLITTCAPTPKSPLSIPKSLSQTQTFSTKLTTIISASTPPKMSIAGTVRKPMPVISINQQSISTPITGIRHATPSITTPITKQKIGIQSKIAITTAPPTFNKANKPIGYKTLRNPPKAWNPTLPPRNLNHPYGGYIPNIDTKKISLSVSTASSSPITTPATTAIISSASSLIAATTISVPVSSTKPNKFFKVRNMPRYLGNPASGVKPMYPMSSPTASTTITSKNDVKVVNSIITTTSSILTLPSTVKRTMPNSTNTSIRATSPTKSLTSIAGKLNTKTTTVQQVLNKEAPPQSRSIPSEIATPPVETSSESIVPKSEILSNSTQSEAKEKVNTPSMASSPAESQNKETSDETKHEPSKTEVPSTGTTMTTSNDKVFQASRNSLKLLLSSRNSTMTVSEMLQLRNSPKTTNPPQLLSKTEQKLSSEAVEHPQSALYDTNKSSNEKEKETIKENNVDKIEIEKTKNIEKTCDEKMNVKESPSESDNQDNKLGELKISQTTVPIYSPRFKQKNDSKFQKSLNSNLRIDVHNVETVETKMLYSSPSPQGSPQPQQKLDKKQKNVPSSPKFERVSSPKTLLISPKSQKSSPTLQMNPMYDQHKTKSPQLDRMSPKQVYKISPTHSKQNYDHKTKSSGGSSSIASSTDKSGNSSTKSPTIKAQLSPKSLSKTDLTTVPSQQKFNFVPANPFIPNLSSPNLSPNFLFSNYAISAANQIMSSYENRLLPQHNCPKNMNSILELSAYHNIPLMSAMFYNQHRLGYPAGPQPPPSSPSGSTSCSLTGSQTLLPSSSAITSPVTSVTNSKSVDSKSKQSKEKNFNNSNEKK